MIGKSPSESLVPKRVGVIHISQVISEVDGNRMTLSQEGAQDSFPLQQKILVCSLLLLTRRLKIKEVTLGKVSQDSQQMELGWRGEFALQSRYFPKGLWCCSWCELKMDFNGENKYWYHVKGSWLLFPLGCGWAFTINLLPFISASPYETQWSPLLALQCRFLAVPPESIFKDFIENGEH